MKIREIMSENVQCASPDDTLVQAAGLMRSLNVGAVPVKDHDRIAGMLTDRDIALRAVAEGKNPKTTTVRETMSEGIIYVFADQDVEDVSDIMRKKQVRRLPVLNQDKRMVGIVSLGDIALHVQIASSGRALKAVSRQKSSVVGKRSARRAKKKTSRTRG